MATEGFEAATLARIVDESQIPVSSVYHYFGSKDGVLLAVMERGAERFFERVAVSTALREDALTHLGWMVDEICAALEEESDFLRLVVVTAVQPPGETRSGALQVVDRVRSVALQRLRGELQIALDLQPGARLARDLARFALAAFDGAFVAWQADPTVRLRQVLKFLPTAVLAAADARAGSAKL